MVVADLHLHTSNSDGTLTLDRIPTVAKQAGLQAVAITDHDRIHPDLSEPLEVIDGVTVIHGIELRVSPETIDQEVDLLGYGVHRTDSLESLVDRLQTNRKARAQQIIDRVDTRLGIDLPIEPHDGIGRPHIARAIASVTDFSYQDAFDELIGTGCPCYVPRDIPSFGEGRSILAEACGLVGLAHPLRYRDPQAAISLCADLDAIERFYPYTRTVNLDTIDEAVERYELIITGGSDAHDESLGITGLDQAHFDAFLDALPLP